MLATPHGACLSVVRRFSAAIITALIAVGVFAPASFAASPTSHATKAVPKVVFVVGPAGAATNGYRAQARAAAAIARRYTPDVVELYSPNATWPAVREALDGASLVVYMGHGNGFPSRYRDELYPPTQNGFGLNPSPGGGDSTHQYFGEGDRRVAGEAGPQRRRPAQPPVLRERSVRAGAARGHARRRPPARRQLRRRLHPGRRVRGHRGGLRQPVVLRPGDPRWRPLHPERLAEQPERERPSDRLRRASAARATSPRWIPGPPTSGLLALDRHEGGAGAEGHPRRRRRQVGRDGPRRCRRCRSNRP